MTERPETELKIICPTLRQYTKEYQRAAAEELKGVYRDNPKLTEMLNDYIALRDACRALEKPVDN